MPQTTFLASGTTAIMNVVEFFCTDGKGRWLLHTRGPMCADEVGKWDFGGGKMKGGESRYHALIREVREEYGPNLRIYATRQLPGYTFFRDSPLHRQHLEVTPFVCLVEAETVNVDSIFAAGKLIVYDWFPITRRFENDTDRGLKIVGLPEDSLHSAIPYVLDRYASEFRGAASMSRWLLDDDGIPLSFKDVTGMEDTANTRAHIVRVEAPDDGSKVPTEV